MSSEEQWPASPASPGPEAVLPQRHPDAVPVGAAIVSHYPNCFGCGQDHPGGLHMQVIAGDLAIQARYEVGQSHQGAPGLAHGGLLATALDEALGALNWLLMTPAVTARLEADFRRPIPVGSLLTIDAWIVGQEGRKVYTRAVGRVDDEIVLTGAAMFVQVGVQHFLDHGDPEAVRAAAAARSRDLQGFEVGP